jgi:hypothetical protein
MKTNELNSYKARRLGASPPSGLSVGVAFCASRAIARREPVRYGTRMGSRSVRAFTLLLVFATAPAVAQTPLSSGVPFPDLVGKTLSGADIVVGSRDGRPKVLIMAFTKDATKAAQAWFDACRVDATAHKESAPDSPLVVCYDVRMVLALPRPVRGFVEGRMRKDVRQQDLDRVVLVYKDKDVWRERMMVMTDSENEPFIILVDRQGRVQSLLHGPFDSVALKTEQAKLVAN